MVDRALRVGWTTYPIRRDNDIDLSIHECNTTEASRLHVKNNVIAWRASLEKHNRATESQMIFVAVILAQSILEVECEFILRCHS